MLQTAHVPNRTCTVTGFKLRHERLARANNRDTDAQSGERAVEPKFTRGGNQLPSDNAGATLELVAATAAPAASGRSDGLAAAVLAFGSGRPRRAGEWFEDAETADTTTGSGAETVDLTSTLLLVT